MLWACGNIKTTQIQTYQMQQIGFVHLFCLCRRGSDMSLVLPLQNVFILPSSPNLSFKKSRAGRTVTNEVLKSCTGPCYQEWSSKHLKTLRFYDVYEFSNVASHRICEITKHMASEESCEDCKTTMGWYGSLLKKCVLDAFCEASSNVFCILDHDVTIEQFILWKETFLCSQSFGFWDILLRGKRNVFSSININGNTFVASQRVTKIIKIKVMVPQVAKNNENENTSVQTKMKERQAQLVKNQPQTCSHPRVSAAQDKLTNWPSEHDQLIGQFG